MKTKAIYSIIGLIVFFVAALLWKLNDYYQAEKIQTSQNQIQQQTLVLKSSISTQLTQLKNILTAYQFGIQESRINWMQLDPFIVLGQFSVNSQLGYEFKTIYNKSGSKADRWTMAFVQKGLGRNKIITKNIVAQVFQTKSGDKYVGLLFADQFKPGSEGVYVISEAQVFQKFFDQQRSQKITHALLTPEQIVVAHSEPDYIASALSDTVMSSKKNFVIQEELRASNLKVVSWTSKKNILGLVNIPFMLVGLIIGFSLILIGVLIYFLKPLEKTLKGLQEEHKKAQLREVAQDLKNPSPQNKPVLTPMSAQPTAVVAKSEPKPAVAKLPVKPDWKPENISNESQVSKPPAQQLVREIQNIISDEVEVTKKMDMPQIQSDPVIVNSEKPQTLTSVIDSMVQKISEDCQQKNISLVFDLLAQNTFKFDSQRMSTLFAHLIQNAIESMQDTDNKHLIVRSYDQNQSTVIEIEDTGIGIDPQIIRQISQPYFTTKNKQQHKGLGLTEAYSIAHRFHCDLDIQNKPTGGVLVKVIMQHPEAIATQSSSSTTTSAPAKDLDLDALLKLDDADEVTPVIATAEVPSLKDEFKTTQFKMDHKIDILEEPNMQVTKKTNSVDTFKVNIRKPERNS